MRLAKLAQDMDGLNHLCGEPRRWTDVLAIHAEKQERLNHLCGEPRRWTR